MVGRLQETACRRSGMRRPTGMGVNEDMAKKSADVGRIGGVLATSRLKSPRATPNVARYETAFLERERPALGPAKRVRRLPRRQRGRRALPAGDEVPARRRAACRLVRGL